MVLFPIQYTAAALREASVPSTAAATLGTQATMQTPGLICTYVWRSAEEASSGEVYQVRTEVGWEPRGGARVSSKSR